MACEPLRTFPVLERSRSRAFRCLHHGPRFAASRSITGQLWRLGQGIGLVPYAHLLAAALPRWASPRWRSLAWLIAGLLATYSIALLLSPYPYSNIDPRLAGVRNPLGILVAKDLFDRLANISLLLLYPTILACIVAVVLRWPPMGKLCLLDWAKIWYGMVCVNL